MRQILVHIERLARSLVTPKDYPWLGALAALSVAFFLAYAALTAPPGFPANSIYTVKPGSTISSVADGLKAAGYVRSSFVFEKLVILLGHERGIMAGDYFFPERQGSFSIAKRLAKGAYGMVPIKVTIPEGYSLRDIAAVFDHKFFKFDEGRFFALSRGKEGFLFPDTYFFMPNITEEDVISLMSDNFDNKTKSIAALIGESKRTLPEIVTMASIIERETVTPEDRRIVSGILWKRLELDMPLQVDATFAYVNGKTKGLDSDDLAIDSPYNTYKYKGLPPTPIANPGLDAIDAALHPTTTKYLYYLSDLSGNIYYAKDLEGHKRNRELYLNK